MLEYTANKHPVNITGIMVLLRYWTGIQEVWIQFSVLP